MSGGLPTVPPLENRALKQFLELLRTRLADVVAEATPEDVGNLRGELLAAVDALNSRLTAVERDDSVKEVYVGQSLPAITHDAVGFQEFDRAAYPGLHIGKVHT